MAEPQPGHPVEYVLSNGMHYIRNYTPGAELAQVQIIVRAGSRDETPQTAGYAHALEHFFFKGAVGYPDSYALDDAIEGVGGQTNAFTGVEMVSYYGNGLKEYVGKLAKVITAMVTQPTFPAAEWPHERQTVLDEAAKRAADPNVWLWDNLMTVAFGGGQPLSWSSIGSIPLVEKSEPQALTDYFHNFYDPSKMAIVISGGATLEPEEVDKLVAAMPHGHNPPRVPAQWGIGDPFVGKPVASPATGQQVQLLMALPGAPVGKDATGESNELAMDMLAGVLGDGNSSRFSAIVRRDPKMASKMEAETNDFDDAGMFLLAATTTPEAQERAAHTMIEQLRKLASAPPSVSELSRAKEHTITQLFRKTESAPDLASYYAERWASKQELITPDELAARIRSVDVAAVQRAAQQVVSRIGDLRFSFIHPVDPATGRNSRGQTLQEAGNSIRAAALQAPVPEVGRAVA